MPIAATQSLYRRTLTKQIAVRRYTGSGPNRPYFDTPCRAKVTGERADQLIGTTNEYIASVVLLVEDLVNGQFALPLTGADKLVINGKESSIIFPDNWTRSDGDTLIAYVVKTKG